MSENPADDDGPGHVLSLLGLVIQDFSEELREELLRGRSRGARAAQQLRGSQLRVLSWTPAGGARVTDLAGRVGMSKQALGEFAARLQELGMLESRPDPGDGRVKILRLTAQGKEVVAAGERAIAKVEQRWIERLGSRRWEDLRAILIEAHALAR